MRGINSTKKTDSSDKTKMACFFNPVFDTKNTEKVVAVKTGYDGEDVEHVIRNAFKHFHM